MAKQTIWFNEAFIAFFKKLAANNHKEWFDENRDIYQREVKKKMEVFVADLIHTLHGKDNSFVTTPSECIFRINRDIRFSKDKSPYKLNTAAIVRPGGKKGESSKGIYIEMGPEKLGLAFGIYEPTKEKMEAVRLKIMENPQAFIRLAEDKKLTKKWGTMQGERAKLLKGEMKEIASVCPYILNKQFYYWVELNSSMILSPKLMSTVLEYFELSIPMAEYLDEA
jgi:uncharacterized protein (TIGR02453 family)